MPSVEMRRKTTRVFGMAKGVDGPRVLRSGRRLWPDSSSPVKPESTKHEWIKLISNSHSHSHPDAAIAVKKEHINKPMVVSVVEKPREINRFGIVYSRKRKRADVDGDRMYGQMFARETRKTDGGCGGVSSRPRVLCVMFDSSSGRRYCAARFLYSILLHLSVSKLHLSRLSQFLASDPIGIVFAIHGITSSWGRSAAVGFGVCKFFESKECIPMFSVDFSAVPLCFMHMHSDLYCRYLFRPILKVWCVDDDEVDQRGSESENCVVLHEADHSDDSLSLPLVKVPKLGCRSTIMYRNGLGLRGSIQKRRSSLRRRRCRNPSFVPIRKHSGALVSELMNIKRNGLSFSSAALNQKLRRSVSMCSAKNPKADRLVQDFDATYCSANLLVSESDRCYREVGVTIMLDKSSSGEWLLVVKKDGVVQLTHKAEKDKIIRPGSNRFTHDIIWCPDSDILRLEFPDRSQWIMFKELYRECSDRNHAIELIPQPASEHDAPAKSIPVPVVREVPGYADTHSSLFLIPESYISMKEDEVSRTFAKKTANYDMDSEDEEWLKKFNEGFELHDHVSEDSFELMIDAFEKAFYRKPYEFSDGVADGAVHFLDMGKREVVEVMYSYWLNKRKQRKLSLLRVFQGHQLKRSLLDSKPVMRKRRSFKRQPSQSGRGKQQSFLQGTHVLDCNSCTAATEQDSVQEQNALLKVEEAKTAADKSVDLAICKRQRAQVLMQNADLATYKAAMAFRIAEAAQVLGSPDAAAVYVLD